MTRRRYYVIGKVGVNVETTDDSGNKSDRFVCEARDWRVAQAIAEALNLKESNRDTNDEYMP